MNIEDTHSLVPNENNNGQRKDTKIKPVFENLITSDVLKNHIQELVKGKEPLPHSEILNQLIEQFEPLEFDALAFPQATQLKGKLENPNLSADERKEINKQLDRLRLNTKHLLVLTVENVLNEAKKHRWDLCKNQDFIYLFNGTFWANIDKETFQKFLGEAAERMGVSKFSARFFQFREQLFKQFLATAYLPSPEPVDNSVLINLQNGTFEISPKGIQLRPFNSNDFITYQLPFEYNPQAKAPIFEKYLNTILPEKEKQKLLAEYLGFVFIKHGSKVLKEEKALILYGTGANGKSVFFEIVNALLGTENISSHSLQDLTNENGYYRAMIANKLVNYASEINGKLEASIFKQIVSGEPITARLPYGQPMQLKQYAKLIFNCNELPKDVEHTNAYFRRFLIVPFDVTIPEKEQDKQLHSKIIENELSGVFNWVLDGLHRLLAQKRFTHCEAVVNAVELYKTQSDSVKLFIQDNNYNNSPNQYEVIKDLYSEYRAYCVDDGFKPVNKQNFIKRLQGFGVVIEKRNIGNVAYLANDRKPF
jgi:putative DNA primase/helicase